MRFIIIQLSDGGDLQKYIYTSREEANEHLGKYDNKCFLIVAEGFTIEDHT